MHQLASVIIGFFISPFNWIVLLIILSFFVKTDKIKKRYWYAALIIFLLFSNNFLLEFYARWWNAKPRDVSADKPYSCGIVLGGFAGPDEHGNGFFNITADRYIQTVKLYKQGKIKHILISGGNGKDEVSSFTEGAFAKQQMIIMGIPDSVIYCEDKSTNTADNAAYSKILLDSLSLKPPYLLITSALHVRRATLIFKNNGIETIDYPCNYVNGISKLDFLDVLPDPVDLFQWKPYLKEAVACGVYHFKKR
ncbi:YdcF family protein [Ferruginibacter albus]|uniref:YdcF family protein n=1 Tax=Ferruginibacter albus TaxID=2875540 RepID=UPI001CC54CE2|nr:YdcF family protein [Ferruginibacter albus]UAY53282.1 YdcF family protein [Ferruginibacter albus]